MSMTASQIIIAGAGWQIPHFGEHATLADALRHGPAPHPRFAPEEELGKKGLRYKERATLLALCASRRALVDAGHASANGEALDDTGFGVVVATNTCNLDTVCRAAETIRDDHVNATSAMDLPNASSNVVSAAIAIRFGLGAMNLTLCSGSSAAIDALVLASNAIRSRRAQRMLVVAVETDGPAARSVLAGKRLEGHDDPAVVLDAAGAVVLESADCSPQRHLSRLAEYAYGHADANGAPGLDAMMANLPHKRSYLPRTSLYQACLPDWLTRDGMAVDLGVLSDQTYCCGPLLALIHHCEEARADVVSTRDGAVILGGASWGDRRGGAIVVERGNKLR